jgi:hypothetical protein
MSNTPATNITSSQSNDPPPPLEEGGGGGTATVSVADVAALPPAGAVMSAFAAIALVKLPAALPVTLSVTVQLAFAGMLALLKVTALVVALTATLAPVQLVAAAGALAMATPAGSVSVKCDCVSAKPFALAKVIVSVDATPGATVLGAKA